MPSDHDAGPGVPRPPAETGGSDTSLSAWRLTFEYEGTDIRLVTRQQVAMLAPPDDAERLEEAKGGFWVEIRDAQGHPLYSQVLHDPIQTDYEVFSPDPGQTPTRVAAPEVKGVFQAVVPDLPGATEVVLHGRASQAELARRPAKQLFKARLHERPSRRGAR